MIERGSIAFLQQAYRNNWQQYMAALCHDGTHNWDICVLTASSERQAAMYRRQLAWRRETGLLPLHTEFLVIPDPDGKRIGSGGATLRVLTELAPRAKDKRVLIIHSGGDSRRLPHCSAIGKLFAQVPRALPTGRASTVFDEFLISLSGLAAELPPGALVLSGDVLLVFDHLQLSFHRPGVIGMAAAAPVETGTHHGVYVSRDGHRIEAYLHKPPVEQLEAWDAIADDGTVAIDTGMVWLDMPTVQKLVALAAEDVIAALCGGSAESSACDAPQPTTGLNFYGDLLMPLAGSTEYDRYLADTSDGPDSDAVRAARQAIWDRLRGVPFSVERMQPAVFLHFGTSQEYWDLVANSPQLAEMCSWARHTASWVPEADRGGYEKCALINALVTRDPTVSSQPVLVVDTHADGPLTLRGAALIAGLHTEQPLTLQADTALHQLPVEGGWVTRVFGLHDGTKDCWDDPSATFMNRPWADWLSQAGIDAETVWPGVDRGQRTLWNARLYPVAAGRQGSLDLALPLQDPAAAPPGWRARWQESRRLSLAESAALADSEQILASIVDIEDEVAVQRFRAAVVDDQPAVAAKRFLGSAAPVVARRGKRIAAWLEHSDPVLQIRGYKALSEAVGEPTWEDRAFAVLATMIEETVNSQSPAAVLRGAAHPAPRRENRLVQAKVAARIDFGGGWTDTPPHSIERGGAVLNAAITLRDQYPIIAEAEWLPEPRLVLESHDIGTQTEPQHVGEVLAYANPADPFALLKAAIVLRGIVSPDQAPDAPLSEALGAFGGLRLCTQTIIPRGSGLGTSSILAGAVLTSLAQLLGVELSQAQLFDEVLCLEQMLTTGGGWQDQVGGLTGGIKLVTTEPGLPQRIRIEPVRMSPDTHAQLRDRLLLVYTGQQRLAKNLLRTVMGHWMAREPEMVHILQEIARLAKDMQHALERGDVDTFGTLLGEHWSLNKRMDPGCTNPFIDDLFKAMKPYICGGKLAGAGGGGFTIVVARDVQAVSSLQFELAARYAGTSVAVWPCGIPEQAVRQESIQRPDGRPRT
jgi:fucokinase